MAILLVNPLSPQRGDFPREQYISDEEDNFIVLYQLFEPLPPGNENLLVNFISLTKRKLSLQFY